jgi:hypothetical protein
MIDALLGEGPQLISTLPSCPQRFDEQERRALWFVLPLAAAA